MVGIARFGGYIPRLRLSRRVVVEANAWGNPALKAMGKSERSMCGWDEDAITLGAAAARDCLGDADASAIRGVYFASTSAPFEDRQCAGVIAEALRVAGPNCTALDVSQSQRAGTSGLIAALSAVAGGAGPILYITAERRLAPAASIQELAFGDGAAALLLDAGDGAATLLGSKSSTVDFVDHYRGENRRFDYGWEERWVRNEGFLKIVPPVVKAVLEEAGVAPSAVTHFCMPCTLRGVAATVAKQAGIPEAAVQDNLHDGCGDTGTAHALVMLVHALERAKPGDILLVTGFGQGCDALLFQVTDAVAKGRSAVGVAGYLARGTVETNYQKFLAFNGMVEMEKSPRSEADRQTKHTVAYRHRDMLLGFIGGRCTSCGTLQIPKSRICVNPNCRAVDTQEDHPFQSYPGRIVTWSADYLTYTPEPPAYYGMVQFAEGGRLMADFTDVDPALMQVGGGVEMVLRVKDRDPTRGFVRYFWKARPVGDSAAAKA